MRNSLLTYNSLSTDHLDRLGKAVASGSITREDYRTVVRLLEGGLRSRKHSPDVVLDALHDRQGAVTNFDTMMLRTAIHKHSDALRPECKNMEAWIELTTFYPGQLPLADSAAQTRRRDAWLEVRAEYHQRRREGRDSVREE